MTSHWITETHFDKDIGIDRKIIPSNEKVSVIYNGIADTAHPKDLNKDLAAEIHSIAFIGRVSQQKNPQIAIASMAYLPSDFRLTVFCNNAKDEALVKKITSLKLENRVKLIDNVNDTAKVIHQYDALLVTSRYEGMPLCMIEAMSASLPIITSNVCGLKELVTDGKNGYLVNDICSAESYAKAIIKLFKSIQHTKDLGLASRQRYLENHTLIKMTNELKRVFSQFC